MCGIYGTTFRYDKATLIAKLNRIRFRGPDNTGMKFYKVSNNEMLTLGHNRLSIIDLNMRSNQPLDYGGIISIVFNGEIYNYKELRNNYLSDVNLKTNSDTEIICALYEKMGPALLSHLNGMFSFVIYDHRNQSLFGARDRLGKKPLYYCLANKSIEFSSQLSAIAMGNEFSIDEQARKYYLLLSYIPDPYCIYKEVKKLKAGHFFIYSISKHSFIETEYWNIFSNSCKFVTPCSYNEAKETVKELLYDSVKLRMIADVPVGLFLSGGVDSSLVASIALKMSSNKLSCFCIGYNDKQYDESIYADRVAHALGVPLNLSVCDADEMLSMTDNFTYFYDEPFADNSLIPTSLIAKKAKRHVTVVLGGDGGDELFYGYNKYQRFIQASYIYKYPWIRSLFYHSFKYFLPDNIRGRLQHPDLYTCYLSEIHYKGEKFDRKEAFRSLLSISYLLNHKRKMLAPSDFDMVEYMNGDINTKVDRGTMRYSLELRSPIMDYRLAEYSRLLPFHYLYDRKQGGKRILKDLLYESVDRRLIDRPKHGFINPLGSLFRNKLKTSLINTVTTSKIEEYIPELDPQAIISCRNSFLNGKRDMPRSLWILYVYLRWIENQP